MTLHYAFVCPHFVFHVGDRLLTTGGAGNATSWDAYSNKTILVHAKNGIAAISYAGLAHIRNTPTDQWLVEKMLPGWTPTIFPSGRGGPSTEINGHHNLTLGGMCKDVIAGIETEFLAEPKASREHTLSVMISGWTWKRRARYGATRARSYHRKIVHLGHADEACKVSRSPLVLHHLEPSSTYVFDPLGMAGDLPYLEQSFAHLFAKGDPVGPDDIEELLVDAIRHASSGPRGDVIGTECMSVFIPFYGYPRLRFIRDVALPETRTAFMPWFVSENLVSPPLVVTGSTPNFALGDGPDALHIINDCKPPLPKSSRSSFGGQPRKRPGN